MQSEIQKESCFKEICTFLRQNCTEIETKDLFSYTKSLYNTNSNISSDFLKRETNHNKFLSIFQRHKCRAGKKIGQIIFKLQSISTKSLDVIDTYLHSES